MTRLFQQKLIKEAEKKLEIGNWGQGKIENHLKILDLKLLRCFIHLANKKQGGETGKI
ncbi:MAG: hypothetical protein V1655_02150 [bacterium]